MSKLTKPFRVETAFAEYELTEVLGEGGAGRVYGGHDIDGTPIAAKFLTQTSTDKRRRFKNEIGFLAKTRHKNLVSVTDYGFSTTGPAIGPFYLMQRYSGSLRQLMSKRIDPNAVMPLYSQILDGVEAAHLSGVTHRDLKPENILIAADGTLAIADFGIASFTADQLVTMVDTKPTQRLANFVYAAPEQKIVGNKITQSADIYALGLLLNELFTGEVPHGTGYRSIATVSPEFAFLDPLVAQMTSQSPSARPSSIGEVKTSIQKYKADAVSLQKIDRLRNLVIPEGEISDPLAHHVPALKAVNWDDGTLTLTLDTVVNQRWNEVLNYRMGGHTSVMGLGPERFMFQGDTARVSVPEHSAQSAIDYLKQWLPVVTRVYKRELEDEMRDIEDRRRKTALRELQQEQRRLEVNSRLTF